MTSEQPSIITLTTDFGGQSPYVAQMKAAILCIAPAARIVDLTHGIPPQDVMAGAIALADSAFHFPEGTVHVAVVDPGVGTERAIVVVQADGHWFVAPDNGLLTGVIKTHRPSVMRTADNPVLWRPEVSHTFHGRDIMAPLAAHLSNRIDPEQIGPRCERFALLDWPLPQRAAGRLCGEVIDVDTFGNLITNIRRADVDDWVAGQSKADRCAVVHCGSNVIRGISLTYADRPAGSLVALFGSTGRLEIAVAGGNAASHTKLSVGVKVTLSMASEASA